MWLCHGERCIICHDDAFDRHSLSAKLQKKKKRLTIWFGGMEVEVQNRHELLANDGTNISSNASRHSQTLRTLFNKFSIDEFDYLFIYFSNFELKHSRTPIDSDHARIECQLKLHACRWVQRQSFRVIVPVCWFILGCDVSKRRTANRTERWWRTYWFGCHVTTHWAHLGKSTT